MSLRITIDFQPWNDYVEQVIDNIKELPEVCNNILVQEMNIAEGLAQVYAPVLSGKLRDTIHLEQEAPNRIALVSDVVNEYGQPYAVYPEMGWGQPAQPHIRPAVEEVVPEIIAGVQGKIADMFKV